MRDPYAVYIRQAVQTGRVAIGRSKVRMRRLTWAEAEGAAALMRAVLRDTPAPPEHKTV